MMMKRILVGCVCLMFALPSRGIAGGDTKEYMAQSIEVLNDSAMMHYHKNLHVTQVLGSVGKEGIPKVIRVGDKIKVKDRELTANFIYVTEALKTMSYGGQVLMKKGDISCVVVESPDNLPYSDEWADRLWINVKQCKPTATNEAGGSDKSLEGYKSPFVILPPIEWAGGDGSSPKEQAYFHGVLETYGFILYGVWPRVAEAEQQFSDYRQCAEDNRDRGWPLTVWISGTALEASMAAQMVRRFIPLVCQEYVKKGSGGWKPPRIVGKEDWQGYGDIERKFYVSAYIETAAELMVLMQQTEDVSILTKCMKDGGIDKVLEKLRSVEVEWQYPMPWTVSKSVGSVCKGG